VPRKLKEHSKNLARENHDEYCLHNAEPVSPKLLATTIHGFSTKSSHNATVQATTTILVAFSAVLSSVSGNSINPTTAANSRNIATSARQFVKAKIEFKNSKPESFAFFWNYHAHHRKINYGVRNQ
jgi:hypothetical protein